MVEDLLKKARKDIEKYCMEECAAYCCRKGFLVLTEDELDIVTKGDHSKIKKQKDGTYALELQRGCPSLEENSCTIHTSRLRPKTCSDFPIFYSGNVVIFSARCPASQTHYFYPLKHELRRLGVSYAIANTIN